MTFLDRTILNGIHRCQAFEVSKTLTSYRQCCRDLGHAENCIWGEWISMPRSEAIAYRAEQIVKRASQVRQINRELARQVDECEGSRS